KGIIITTSSFAEDAKGFVERNKLPSVVLIDGERLADLMIEHGLGVSEIKSYKLMGIDSDYFEDIGDEPS
ncbi:restriction endonuclease, partial [bacterium]|nr:restriction endonuclease [bacterium]